MPESEVSSLIKTIAGKIPYGDMLKAALGPMLKDLRRNAKVFFY